MNQGSGPGKSTGYSEADKLAAKVHVPENPKCVTPHAREFLKVCLSCQFLTLLQAWYM